MRDSLWMTSWPSRVLALFLATGSCAWGQVPPLSAGIYAQRALDWRNGAVVYQVMVDRFAPSADLQAKRALYPPPKVLHPWSEPARRGRFVASQHVWSHELDFWGGDLQSTRSRLDYLQDLGVQVLYLNPIHLAFTNHKYDALDYLQISPEFGSAADLQQLTEDLHARGMKLVLDGVFNHMGRNSKAFRQAQADPGSALRDWFYFGAQYPDGARGWYQAGNLPELNLENPAVRDYLYRAPNSVVQTYLRQGSDGWRLDVAAELGPVFLAELSAAAHTAKPGSLVVAEIGNYPRDWLPSVDGVINFTLRDIVLSTLQGLIAPSTAAQMLERTVHDAGIDATLKSWLMLDNHDNPRLNASLPALAQQRAAQVLQFTLPGAPNLYYGTELGMGGAEDPANRSPMRWDLVGPHNAALQWSRQLVALHRTHRALQVGDFRLVNASQLLAFERYTDRVEDTVVVLLNPSKRTVTERVLIANSWLMNGGALVDLLDPKGAPLRVMAGLTTVTLPPGGFKVVAPDVATHGGYTSYKRVP